MKFMFFLLFVIALVHGIFVRRENIPENMFAGLEAIAVTLDGYDFVQGKDSGGNDITGLGTGDVQQLKSFCDKRPDCKGFNTNGWVKSVLVPQSQWSTFSSDPNAGTYVKKPQNDYYFVQGLDSGGGDIGNAGTTNVPQLKSLCDSKPECKGFNTNGWVKSTLLPRTQWYSFSTDPNAGTWVKKVAVEYEFVQGKDSPGNDITNLGTTDRQALKKYCDARLDCKGFNTNGWVKNVLVVPSQWSTFSTDLTSGTWVKKILHDYEFVQGRDSGGGDINNAGNTNLQHLRSTCDANTECKGFNTNGWVKKSLIPRTQWSTFSTDPNAGTYVKRPTYQFVQGQDSGGNDIGFLGPDVVALKNTCDANASCRGFNTNGWYKSSLVPSSQWYSFSTEPTAGFWVKNG